MFMMNGYVSTATEALSKSYSVELDVRKAANLFDDPIISNGGENKLFSAESTERSATNSSLQMGTISNYLSQANDYHLYSLNLPAGNYLQARLTSPNDSNIDYDLLLFDSSLTLIKSSDYVTYINTSTDTIQESLGYIANTTISLYVCVYSVAGGSTTSPYTLDFSISDSYDSVESDENAAESNALNLGTLGTSVTRTLNSPLDNDWYSLTVLDSPAYNKIRLNLSNTSTTNGVWIEIYQNIGTNCYAMYFIGSGNGGDIELSPGNYYLRMVSTNTLADFDENDIPTYTLSVAPVSRVDYLEITDMSGNTYTEAVTYNGITFPRINGGETLVVHVVAKYYDESNVAHPSVNAIVEGDLYDPSWNGTNNTGYIHRYANAFTDSNGACYLIFNTQPAIGAYNCWVTVSTHYYDKAYINVKNGDTTEIQPIFLLKNSDYNN